MDQKTALVFLASAAAGTLLAAALIDWRSDDPAPAPDQGAQAHKEPTFRPTLLAGLADTPLGRDDVPDEAEPGQTWIPDEFMVRLLPGASIDTVASTLGAEVLRVPGRSGYAVLAAPRHGGELLRERLANAPDVAAVSPVARVMGARSMMSGIGMSPTAYSGSEVGWQWHLSNLHASSSMLRLSGIVVAVVDSGVAFEDYADEFGSYVCAPSLGRTLFVAPWDFVHGDAHPNDDHQHGTHIASSIGSAGAVLGVAPGVSIMPLKVLDEHNRGTEADLIDAIYWAVDNGADVVNMSLSFGDDYVPSLPLLEALEHAVNNQVVMLAASGNAGLPWVSWPAASPRVIAVGGGCMSAGANWKLDPADYANDGPVVDLVAPGGCIDRDDNGDGYPDGILAESIDPDDPTHTGLWFMAGTSQATALASGTAAALLGMGLAPHDVRYALQQGAMADFDEPIESGGLGAGALDMKQSLMVASVVDGTEDDYRVAMLPFIARDEDGLPAPAALLSVLGPDLAPWSEGVLIGTFHGSTDGWFQCELVDGSCVVQGASVATPDAAVVWTITVDGVVDGDLIYRPTGVFFASDALDATIDWMQSEPELEDSVLGIYWPEGDDPDLGLVAEGYGVVASGAGISTSPMGLLFNPAAVADLGTIETLEIDGSGISTSPFGIRIVTLDGSGISTSPFGIKLTTFDGTGISTSPFGVKATLTTLDGASIVCTDCLFDGDPVLLDTGSIASSVSSEGTALQGLLDDGGWVTSDGYDAAMALGGSSMMEAKEALQIAPVGESLSMGAVPME